MRGRVRMDDARRDLKSALRRWGRRIVAVEELQSMAGDGNYLAFCELISELETEGILSPVRASGYNGRSPSLFNRYRIAVEDTPRPAFGDEIPTLPTESAVRYYRAHPEQYQHDRPFVRAICRFILDGRAHPPVTVNERSYQLFRDEKALKEGRGKIVLGRMGLGHDDLCMIPTAEPFAHFDLRYLGGDDRALIIENLDTFISVHRCLRTGTPLLGEMMPGFIVYGEGNKILSSFQFAREVPGLGEEAAYLYFGDLDYEGISIYRRLAQHYETFTITPWVTGYLGLIRVEPDPPRGRAAQRETSLRSFLASFPPRQARNIEEMISGGAYIPQEALTLAHMKGEIPLDP